MLGNNFGTLKFSVSLLLEHHVTLRSLGLHSHPKPKGFDSALCFGEFVGVGSVKP